MTGNPDDARVLALTAVRTDATEATAHAMLGVAKEALREQALRPGRRR